jgi:uncharacterized membrane protein YfcA
MLIHTLHFEPASILVAVVCSLIVAGLLKGVIGVGMPVVALPLLSLFIDVKSAAMLLSMPLVLSNLPQALEGGRTGRCFMELTPVFLGMIPGLFLGGRATAAVRCDVRRSSLTYDRTLHCHSFNASRRAPQRERKQDHWLA